MKNKILLGALFLSLPVLLLIMVVIKRGATYQGNSASVWFDQIQTLGETNVNGPQIIALRSMGISAVPVVQNALKSSKRYERAKAAWVLGQLGSVASNAVPDLILALDDADPSTQNYAIAALAAISTTSEAAVPKLVAKLSSPNPAISYFAADLLDKIENERHAKSLPPVSGDEYERAMSFVRATLPTIRVKGVNRLAKLASKDERAAATLKSLANDTNGSVRQAAAALLAKQSDAGKPTGN